MSTFTVTLPLPPSLNHRWRYDPRTGRPHVDPRLRAWMDTAGPVFRAAGLRTMPPGNYSMEVEGIIRCPPNGDIDNYLKACIDGVALLTGVNDKALRHIDVWKEAPGKRALYGAELRITIEPVKGTASSPSKRRKRA